MVFPRTMFYMLEDGTTLPQPMNPAPYTDSNEGPPWGSLLRYVYVHEYVCICIYVYAHLCANTHIHTDIYVHTLPGCSFRPLVEWLSTTPT